MANIAPIVDSSHSPSPSAPLPKLALFSGHDTTLMPMLATLGDKVWSGTEWAPYASIILIEIHEILNADEAFPSGYAFRLIYNGQVLTSKMDGCAAGSELCDSQVLVKQVMPFAKYMERDCASTFAPAVPPAAPASDSDDLMKEMKTATENLVAAPGGVWVIVVTVLISMTAGGILMWLLMRRQMKKYADYRRESVLGDLSLRVMSNDENQFHTEGDQGGIDSAVSTGGYGATNEDEKKVDFPNLL